MFIPPYVTLAEQRMNSWLRVVTQSSGFLEEQSIVVIRYVHASNTPLGFKSPSILLMSHWVGSGKLLNPYVSCRLTREIRQIWFYGLRKIDMAKTQNGASCITSSQPMTVWVIFFLASHSILM